MTKQIINSSIAYEKSLKTSYQIFSAIKSHTP